MAVSTWFDSATYMAAKLKQVQQGDPSMTAEKLQQAFNEAGFVGEEGAQQHFIQYGQYEELAPNAFFDYTEYYRAKAADHFKLTDPKEVTDAQVSTIKKAFSDANMSAWSHYQQYGTSEGINASNSFDTSAYMQAKLDAVNAGKTDGKITMAELTAAFQKAGFTALDHFMTYGGTGAGEVAQRFEGSIPTEFSVPEDNKVKPSDEHMGATINLTKDVDIVSPTVEAAAFRTTVKNDTINGVVSSLTASRTLNAGDQIDGGAGDDTLALDMQGSFSGFTGEGGVKNVEHVVLSNKTSMTRDFSTKGITDVVDYTLKGAVSLSQLADTEARVNVTERASGTATIGFASKVTDGDNDEFTVGVSKLGSAVGTADPTRVAISVAGIETLNLVAMSGENYVALSGNSATAVTVSGKANLNLAKVGTGVKAFDASVATGNVTVDLTDVVATGQISSIKGGHGDDTIHVKADALRANAEISGGEGQDTLVLTSTAAATKQLQMSGVETVMVGALGGKLTLAAADTTDLAKVVASDKMNNDVTFVDLGTSDMAVQLKGSNADTHTLSLDHSGSTKLVIDTPAAAATKAAPSTNALKVALSDSAAVDVSVAEKMSYMGTITAGKASGVTLAVEGQLTGATVNAAEATGIEITSVANASSLTLNADKAESLTVTAAASFGLSGSLDSLQGLTVTTDKTFNSSTVDMDNLALASLSGTGSVALGNIGADKVEHGVEIIATGLSSNAAGSGVSLLTGTITTQDQDISVNTTGVLGKVDLGAITAGGESNVTLTFGKVTDIALDAVSGKNVTIDASGVLDSTTYGGAISVGDTLVLNGSKIAGNDWTSGDINATGAKLDATINGGIGADKFDITNTGANTTDIVLKGSLGAGTNVVTISGGKATGVTYDAREFSVGSVDSSSTIKITGTAGKDTIYAAKDGTNTLIGGAGADTFHLGGGDDIVQYSATGEFGGTQTGGYDALEHIKGFGDAGSDVIEFEASLLGLTGTADVSFATIGANGSLASGKVNEVSLGFTAGKFAYNVADVVGALAAASITAFAANGAKGILAFENGSDTYLWYFEDGVTSGSIDASDLKLIGVLDGIHGATAFEQGDVITY